MSNFIALWLWSLTNDDDHDDDNNKRESAMYSAGLVARGNFHVGKSIWWTELMIFDLCEILSIDNDKHKQHQYR